MVVIARTTSIDAERLSEALRAIFARRATHAIPRSLESPPPEWARPWEALVTHLPADRELQAGFDTAAALWDPVLAGAADAMMWNPLAAIWQPRLIAVERGRSVRLVGPPARRPTLRNARQERENPPERAFTRSG